MKSFYKTFLLLFINVSFLVFNSFSQQAPGIEWQKSLGGSDLDFGYSVTQTFDGGYIVAGQTWSNDSDVTNNHGGADYWIVKLDAAGGVQWQKTLGGTNSDIAYSIKQTTDGGYIVAGSSSSSDGDATLNNGDDDYWIVKLNNTGNIEWQKSYGGSQQDVAYSIVQTMDGGFFTAGFSISNDSDVTGNHGSYDFWTIKLDNLGNLQWQKSFGGSLLDQAFSCQQTSDGGYIVSGGAKSSDGDATTNHGDTDYWIIKINSSGNMEWQKSFGGTNVDQADFIYQTSDGSFVVAGLSYSNDGDVTGNHGSFDDWIIKLDTAGNLQWQKSLGGSGYDFAACIRQTSDGGYIVCGGSDSNDGDVTNNHGDSDFWLLKLDSLGALNWQKCLGGTNGDDSYSIVQTTDGGYVIAGQTLSGDGDVTVNNGIVDYWIVKLLPDTITSTFNIQHSASNITISPNPSSGIFQITFPSSNTNQKTNYTLEVISTLGQTVFASDLRLPTSDLQTQIDVSFLPKGIYVLKISGSVLTGNKIFVVD